MHRVKHIDYDEDDFYDDEGEDAGGEYNNDGGNQGAGLTAEDRENFASLTPVVRAELDEAGLQASDKEIQDALWHYYWDVGKSVVYLKSIKAPRLQKAQQQQQQQQLGKKEKPKSKFDQAAEKRVVPTGNAKGGHATNGLVQKAESLKLDPSTTTTTTTTAAPVQPKVKSKGLDVPALWQQQASKRKPSTAFVVIGHVDHGKSTLMGRLLLDTGAVAQRDIDKYKKQATEMGKSSFALAWVMDTGSEERERGVTADIAQHHFATDKVDFTILDAPGHRDFVPNMIGGASMADVAVLVVDANQLESGMKGQTKEHIVLAKACGLSRIVVAVNKLDTTNPPWAESAFEDVRVEISKFLKSAGYPDDSISFVPCSGLTGVNVVKPANGDGETKWIPGTFPTLLRALEDSTATQITNEAASSALKMQITDVFRGGIQNPLTVSGRLSAGNAQVGDSVLIQPSGESATIKGIEVSGEAQDFVVAGQLCSLHLTDIDPQHLRAGDVLCSASDPVAVVKSFVCRVAAIDALLPHGVDVHVGRLHVPGSISQLVALVDARGDVLRKRPRVVKEGQTSLVKLSLAAGTPLAMGDRVVLRVGGSTVAAGLIDSVGP